METICVTHLVTMPNETENRAGEFQSRPRRACQHLFHRPV